MRARGKPRSASPLVNDQKARQGLEGRNSSAVLCPFRAGMKFLTFYQGRRAPLRFALAPGFHILRLWRYKAAPVFAIILSL